MSVEFNDALGETPPPAPAETLYQQEAADVSSAYYQAYPYLYAQVHTFTQLIPDSHRPHTK
jgi:hypothetical protein